MSSDNGIYIAEFPTANGKKEYRVAEAMAIDNCDLQWMPLSPERTEMEDAYRMSYFGDCVPFATLAEATKEAQHIYESMGYRPLLEYGICCLHFSRPLVDMTPEESKDILGF